MDLAELQKTHSLYSNYKKEWDFYINSYRGGKSYRDGNYLKQHPFESETNYKRRKEIAYYYNYCAPVIDITTSYLYKKAPKRSYGSLSREVVPPRKPNTLFDAFWYDCDLDGTNFEQFIRMAQRYASIYGRVSIIVDKPVATATNLAEALTRGIYPYLTLITPENLLDWKHTRADNGRWELIYCKIMESPDTYRLWYKDKWELWQVEKSTPSLKGEGVNPLGVIPMVTLYNNKTCTRMLGDSDIQDIADINKNIYYLCSDALEIIENTAFPMLAMPIGGGGADGDTNTKAVGPKNIISFDPQDPNSKPYWLEPPNSSLSEIREWVIQHAQEITRIAKMGGTRNVETSVQPWSGVSIEAMEQQLYSALIEKASNCEQAELDILNLFALWEKTTFDGEVIYAREFAVRDLTISLQNALNASNAKIQSMIFERERQKKVVRSILPDAEEATMDKIFKEIEDAPLVNTGANNNASVQPGASNGGN